MKNVSGRKIADINQIGGSPMRSTMNIRGTITWPVIRIVRYGGASSARARPNGA